MDKIVKIDAEWRALLTPKPSFSTGFRATLP